MFFKALLVLAFAAVAVQSFAPYEKEVLQVDQLGDSIIGELKKLVVDAIKTATDKLKNLARDFYNKVKTLAANATEALKKQLGNLLDQLNRIKEEAKALGINIADCLKDNEDNLKNLGKKYGEKIRSCSRDIVERGKGVIQNANSTVEETKQQVKELSDEFKACGSGFKSLPCKSLVSYKIGKAIVYLPVDIIRIVADAVPEIAALYPELQHCTVEETKAFFHEGEKIIQDIDQCVQDKIKPPQNATTEATF